MWPTLALRKTDIRKDDHEVSRSAPNDGGDPNATIKMIINGI